MKYRIVEDSNAVDLANRIEGLIAIGWKLQGGISACVFQGHTRYYQAMIKEV